MKNILFILLVFAVFFFSISCGDDSEAHDESGDDRNNVEIQDDETDMTTTGDTDYIENSDNEEPDLEKNDEDRCGTPFNDIVDPVEGYESYFAFLGVGKINSADVETNPEGVMLSKMNFKLKDYPQRVLSMSFEYFIDDPDDPDGEALSLIVSGDPEGDEYGTLVLTSLPLRWIEIFKESEVTDAPFSTMVQVFSIREVSDEISEVCIIAASMLKDYEGNELPEGKLQICYDCNETFDPGESLRFGVNARLTTDPDTIVETLNELDSTEELCDCVDSEGHVTDCPEENS